MEISQEQAARLPFRSRYPTAKLVAWILDQAGMLRPLQPLRVIDMTYGQGIFWHALRGKVILAAADTRRLEWVTRPKCFLQRPAQRWREWLPEALGCLGGKVDLVTVDPPWQTARRGYEPGGRYHYRAASAYGKPEDILRSGLEIAREFGVPVLYHWREPLSARHAVGPVAFKPFFRIMNPKASRYRSYFGVIDGA